MEENVALQRTFPKKARGGVAAKNARKAAKNDLKAAKNVSEPLAGTSKRRKRTRPLEYAPDSEDDGVADMLDDHNSDDERIISNMQLDEEPEYESDEEPDSANLGNPSGAEEGNAHTSTTSFREDIANMPLGKAKLLKEKLGLRLFNKAFFNVDDSTSKPKPRSSERFKRDNPKRPREMSSKRPVSRFRKVYSNESAEKKRYDPRFNEQCGEFDKHIYETNFDFLEDLRQNEKQLLQNEIKVAQREDPEKAQQMKEALRRITNREKTKAEEARRKEVIREVRRENNERMRQGLKPIFKTRGEVKKLVLEKKFEELKKTHKLDKYIERRAKKQNRKKNLTM